jgi:hypothetical protein
MKVEIGHLGMGQRELKSEIKDLRNRMDRDIKDLGKKIDRVLYAIITGIIGWMIKGGYDIYDEKPFCIPTFTKSSRDPEAAIAWVSVVESTHLKRFMTD